MKNTNQRVCHPERSEQGSCTASTMSQKILRDRSLGMTMQSGRSMVEMLGVLAIFGILTVVGIAGLQSAMDSHTANEIVAAVNRRVVAWAGNKTFRQGFDVFPSDELNYTWETPKEMANYIQFSIVGIAPKVCQKIHQMNWQTVFVNADCSTFAFNQELKNDLTCSESCGGCMVCNTVMGECISNGACTEGKICSSNTDCDPAHFCNLEVGQNTGSCASINPTKYTITGISGNFYKGPSMSKQAATNYCDRLGGRLPSVSELNCGYDFVGNDSYGGLCRKDTVLETHTNCPDNSTLSDIAKDINVKMGNGCTITFWLDDMKSSGTSYYYRWGRISSRNLDTGSYSVVCVK